MSDPIEIAIEQLQSARKIIQDANIVLRPGFRGNLTKKQHEVLRLLANGMQSKEVAQKMKASVRAIDGVRIRIVANLGARNITHAVWIAAKRGLL